MKRVLVLGAGLVSKPGVRYLLDQDHIFVTVASRTVSKAEKLIENGTNCEAFPLDIQNVDILEKLIKDNDVVVSLLPWVHHLTVAKLCLKFRKQMATTSYVSSDMQRLDSEVGEAGLLFLNEIGVDPGIDHMSAMRIIDEIAEEGGKVTHFYSYCGGLPAPEANDNPFGYKFSWSPKGVVLASRNSAKYLENGELVDIKGEDLFSNCRIEEIEGMGQFEVYPNRDSMPYKELYGLNDALTVMRGTYRNLGWCRTLKKIVDLGLVDDTPDQTLRGESYRKMMAGLVNSGADGDIRAETAAKISEDPGSDVMDRLEWLGLFSDETMPNLDNRLDILCDLLQEKLAYTEGERDMILLQHRFTVENRDNTKDLYTSTLVDYGHYGGETSMARTVSLPLAIGVKLMAEGSINLTGVRIPIEKEIYEPVMAELATLGIEMAEKRTRL